LEVVPFLPESSVQYGTDRRHTASGTWLP